MLDVPCGTGRLQPVLAALASEQLAIDVSGGMLAQSGQPWRLQASAFRLPSIDASFDAVICCRLMHHCTRTPIDFGLLRELLRVTRGPVLLSFWDAGSWHAWRRRHGLRKVRNEDGRQAMPRRHLAELVEQAGGRVLAWRHSMRGISQQAWVAIETRGARP
ncbi:MAG: class I SAM-dependent methyltransferase [Planctomycetota bacterium]